MLRVAHGLSQSQLGDLIGARRETVNRANRALAAEGLVGDGPRGTELRDVKGLAARAGRTPGGEPGAPRRILNWSDANCQVHLRTPGWRRKSAGVTLLV